MRRYETLTPDDIIRICDEWADLSAKDPDWCKAEYNEADDNRICPWCLSCDDCLREWLEEEIKPDPVWYSKQFIMEQVAALIEHDESGLSLFHILDEVLADTPEQIRYGSVDKYLKAMEEAKV